MRANESDDVRPLLSAMFDPAVAAVLTPSTLERARALGDSVVTSPTHTDVNDFRAVLVAAA